jgi:hypothetical protein
LPSTALVSTLPPTDPESEAYAGQTWKGPIPGVSSLPNPHTLRRRGPWTVLISACAEQLSVLRGEWSQRSACSATTVAATPEDQESSAQGRRGQFWWRSLTIVGGRRGPLRSVDLLEHPGRSVLECRAQTSKARQGSRPPWVQILPLPPLTSRHTGQVNCGLTRHVSIGLSCPGHAARTDAMAC